MLPSGFKCTNCSMASELGKSLKLLFLGNLVPMITSMLWMISWSLGNRVLYRSFTRNSYMLNTNCTCTTLHWMIQYFVQQFVRGLKPDIRGAVQSQDPDTIEKALHLASIQENIVSRNKFKPTKPAPLTRPFPSAVKDSKHHNRIVNCGKQDKQEITRRPTIFVIIVDNPSFLPILTLAWRDQRDNFIN